MSIPRRVRVQKGKLSGMRWHHFETPIAAENQKQGLLDGIKFHMRQNVLVDKVGAWGLRLSEQTYDKE